MVICPTLVAEVREVLRLGLDYEKWISLADARSFIDTVETLVDLVADPEQIYVGLRDSDDDYLVCLAREHGVGVIVTGDKDLLEWEEQRLPVITPASFEGRLRIEHSE